MSNESMQFNISVCKNGVHEAESARRDCEGYPRVSALG